MVYSRLVGLLTYTVISHLSKELNSENAVQRHEEQEEDGHVIDLLTRSSASTSTDHTLTVSSVDCQWTADRTGGEEDRGGEGRRRDSCVPFLKFLDPSLIVATGVDLL